MGLTLRHYGTRGMPARQFLEYQNSVSCFSNLRTFSFSFCGAEVHKLQPRGQIYLCVKVAQLCLTLCNSIDYPVLGILQARILEKGLSLLQRIFPTQELNLGLRRCRQILFQLSYQGGSIYLYLSVFKMICLKKIKINHDIFMLT